MYEQQQKRIAALALAILVFGGVIAGLVLLFRGYSAEAQREPEKKPQVIFSEVMSSNGSFAAPDGEFYDWIELYNPQGAPADLSGWGLSDRADEIKYVFPDGTKVPGNGYMVVWCFKATDRDDTAPFALSAQGEETVYLFDSEGGAAEELVLPAMEKDTSWQRGRDGAWAVTVTPTPGEVNVLTPPAAPQRAETDVVIAELRSTGRIGLRDQDGEYSDWAELYNAGDAPADLSGWYLSDDPDKPCKWEIPSLVLEAGERTVVFCSGKDRREGELHTSFALSKSGGGLYLADPDGVPAGELLYDAMERDQVCRLTDSGVEYSYEATPGYPNTPEGYEEYIAAADVHGSIVINEVVAYYNGKFTDGRKQSYDWLELKNVSDQPVSLAGYFLTNDTRDPEVCPLPNVTLKPGALYVVFCAKDVKLLDGKHTYAPFNISSRGERVYLFSPEGELSDSVFVHDLPYAGSIGRLNGGQGFYLFETPTPDKENTGGFRCKAESVTADVDSGIYNGVESLTVSLLGEGEIRYTTDGSVPTRNSSLYTEPFSLTKTTVIRAAAFPQGKAASDTAFFSYIINENHTLPVASLICEPKGFRTLVNTTGYKVSVDGHLALYNADGLEFESGCSVRLHGNTSRFFRAKRLLMVEFNNRFGGNINYDVFGNGITEYSSLLLRGEQTRFAYILRDSVAALTANRLCEMPLTLDNRYCILYVNGSYFGVYPLREDYSRQYVASHTGSSADSVRVVTGPVSSSTAPDTNLFEVLNYIVTHDMSAPEHYAWAAERLDMEAMADWLLLEGYFNNHDVGGNIRYIYGDNTGGKWRPAFFDLDIAMTGPTPGYQNVIYGGDQINVVCRSLLMNGEFKDLFALRLVKMLENGLKDNVPLQILNECIDEITAEIPRDNVRWRTTSVNWDGVVRSCRNYLSDQRVRDFIDLVSSMAGLSPERKQELYGAYLQ